MFMTPMTLLTCLQNDRLDPRQLHDRKKRRIDAIVRKSNYIGGLPHSARHAYRSNRRALCGNYLTAILCPQLLVITIVSNELYLLRSPRIPVGEEPYAVGQWGTWVATALVLIAAMMDHRREIAEKGRGGRVDGRSGNQLPSRQPVILEQPPNRPAKAQIES